jgi:hypothetical protein
MRLAFPVRRERFKELSIKSGNIFESTRQREYPMPTLRGAGFSDLMAKAARRLGWHPYSPPAAINSVPYEKRTACFYHGFCGSGWLPNQRKRLDRGNNDS